MRWASIIWVSWSILSFFRRLGAIGCFLAGALDSSFLFLPLVSELLLLVLISSAHGGAIWIVYVLSMVLGSMLGTYIMDIPLRKAGEKGLSHFFKPRRISRLKARLEKNGSWAVFLSALMPPPFPTKAVIFTASALQMPRKTLLLSCFFARLIRFSVTGLLALYLGRRLIKYLNSDAVEYSMYALVAITVIGSLIVAIKPLSGWRESGKVGKVH